MSNDDNDRILLLDGGMGTTLENLSHNVSSSLWGLELLHTDPDAIEGIHRRFLDSGADIIETASYQLTPELLDRYFSTSTSTTHNNDVDSSDILRKAVIVANNARSSSNSQSSKRKGIAISFGPYGSTLQPGQEYGGIYPPPFGPSPSSSSSSSTNAFPQSVEGKEEEAKAIEALAQHHLIKLRIYAENEDVWKNVDWLAFETVPVIHEIKGIRRAISLLNEELRERYSTSESSSSALEDGWEWWKKKFWITCPFPNGQHPQLLSDSTSDHVTVEQVVESLLLVDDGDGEIPNGIGINCTHPKYLNDLIKQFTESLRRLLPIINNDNHGKERERPVFVLYPDGGQIYDVVTRTWTNDGNQSTEDWAQGIMDIVRQLDYATVTVEKGVEEGGGNREKLWKGVIVGGCCKTSFEEISALRKEIDKVKI